MTEGEPFAMESDCSVDSPTCYYDSLLIAFRLRSSTIDRPNISVEAESDRGRVLFCPSFRRLQQKAQVFSLESNAAVRSRLTHSLEVAQIGRLLAELVADKLVTAEELSADRKQAFVTFVETACLMHDIGNPPFGHFGEAAIKSWFSEHGREALGEALGLGAGGVEGDLCSRAKDALSDFLEFDGNPQGFRIVASLQGYNDSAGLNLTVTTLASFLKYVRPSGDKGVPPFNKKAGYFQSEKAIVQEVWQKLGYTSPQRFPLAYIMEAADDIAYCVSDLEDSAEKRIVDAEAAIREIKENYLARIDSENDDRLDASHSSHRRVLKVLDDYLGDASLKGNYTQFRAALNWILVQDACSMYIDEHAQVKAGALTTLLPKTLPSGAILDELRTFCRKRVYVHESVQKVELAGYAAIKGLLDNFRCLLQLSEADFLCALDDKRESSSGKSIVIPAKLLSLFPEKHKRAYRNFPKSDCFGEWQARAHLVVDYVSGMTDDFSVSMHRMLGGTNL